LYESLVSREEMVRAVELENYYMIPADNRDLNYAKYFSEGNSMLASLEDYTSHNTERLNIDQVETLVRGLDCIKDGLLDI